MIRVLATGPDAPGWVARLQAVAPAVEFEAARLPAAAVRSFDREPADLLLLCGKDAGRLAQLLAALRARPLGDLVPSVGLADEAIDGVDDQLPLGADAAVVVNRIATHLGLAPEEIGAAPQSAPEAPVLSAVAAVEPATALPDAIARKLRDVRHGSYFDVLEVAPEATRYDLDAAYDRQTARFLPPEVPLDVARDFAAPLAEVREGLEDAFAVLADPALRTAYMAGRRGTESA